jgi:hypothetical protein
VLRAAQRAPLVTRQVARLARLGARQAARREPPEARQAAQLARREVRRAAQRERRETRPAVRQVLLASDQQFNEKGPARAGGAPLEVRGTTPAQAPGSTLLQRACRKNSRSAR